MRSGSVRSFVLVSITCDRHSVESTASLFHVTGLAKVSRDVDRSLEVLVRVVEASDGHVRFVAVRVSRREEHRQRGRSLQVPATVGVLVGPQRTSQRPPFDESPQGSLHSRRPRSNRPGPGWGRETSRGSFHFGTPQD